MRKTQEQRRRETQEAVLSSALQVLIEAGYARFSAGRVAARAGVSRGALEHYFPTKNDLLLAVTQYVIDKAVKDTKLLAAKGPKQTDPISRFLLDSEHFFFSPVYRGMIELAIAASGDSDLSEPHDAIVVRGRRDLDQTWLDTLVAAGFPHKNAELFIHLTHYFLRGVFLASTWLPYNPNRRALMEAWSALAPAILGLKESPTVLRLPGRGRTRVRQDAATPRTRARDKKPA